MNPPRSQMHKLVSGLLRQKPIIFDRTPESRCRSKSWECQILLVYRVFDPFLFLDIDQGGWSHCLQSREFMGILKHKNVKYCCCTSIDWRRETAMAWILVRIWAIEVTIFLFSAKKTSLMRRVRLFARNSNKTRLVSIFYMIRHKTFENILWSLDWSCIRIGSSCSLLDRRSFDRRAQSSE